MPTSCPSPTITTVFYCNLTIYFYWKLLLICGCKYSPNFRSMDRFKQMKIVSYFTDFTIRISGCIFVGYFLWKGHMDSKLRLSLEDVGRDDCFLLSVFYILSILWGCELLMQLCSEDLGWDMHFHHFMGILTCAYFVDGTSVLHRDAVFAGTSLILIFGGGVFGTHHLAMVFYHLIGKRRVKMWHKLLVKALTIACLLEMTPRRSLFGILQLLI